MTAQLEWHDKYDGKIYALRHIQGAGGSILDDYEISPSEKHGGFNVYGLRGDTGWAKTLKAAKTVAEDDYRTRQRMLAWQRYMEANDPPEVKP